MDRDVTCILTTLVGQRDGVGLAHQAEREAAPGLAHLGPVTRLSLGLPHRLAQSRSGRLGSHPSQRVGREEEGVGLGLLELADQERHRLVAELLHPAHGLDEVVVFDITALCRSPKKLERVFHGLAQLLLTDQLLRGRGLLGAGAGQEEVQQDREQRSRQAERRTQERDLRRSRLSNIPIDVKRGKKAPVVVPEARCGVEERGL